MAENRNDLVPRPDVEFAFDALAVGVEARAERAARSGHLALDPANRLPRARAKQFVARFMMRKRQHFENLRIVVEHFFKVRHEPAIIRRIARIAAAEMIVDAALRHMLQREAHAGPVGRFPEPSARAPQKFEDRRVGKFRRALEAAIDAIHRLQQMRRNLVRKRQRKLARAGAMRIGLRQPRANGLDIFRDAVRLGAERVLHRAKHADEGRAAVLVLLRKICPAPERLACRRKEHRHRPAAALAERVQRRHIDMVDIGPLLAIDLDVDEELVHHRRGRLVLEALMRHHMAPVAGRVADRQQDRFALGLRVAQRGLAPHPPMDGIIRVLQQIRARGVFQFIGGHVQALFRRPRKSSPGRRARTGESARARPAPRLRPSRMSHC